MPTISLTLPVSGNVITAGLHATNYTAIQGLVNGGLDTANWASGKIFAPSKFVQEGATAGQEVRWDNTNSKYVPDGGYGTALPASPVDGAQFTLVDSTTLPTYAWRFRYNAGSSNTDKWEFIGGSVLSAEVATAETTTSTTYTDLATAGPSVTVPRAGVYVIEMNCEINLTVAASVAAARMSAKLGSASAADAESIAETLSVVTTESRTAAGAMRRTLAASDVVKAQYKTAANTAQFQRRRLAVIPVRVS